MPNTCTTPFKVRTSPAHSVKVHNVILCLSHESYSGILAGLVTEALASIDHSFPGLQSEVQGLRDFAAAAPHSALLAVFFLLLNVDPVLKNKVIALDSEANLGKLTRFLLDLRKLLAVRFFTDETCTPAVFQDACVDCYLVS